MAIPKEQLDMFREALDRSQNPLFLFDDDPDGLSSFLLLYRYKNAGKGMIVKSLPEVPESFAEVVIRFDPDIVFILDKPLVKQEFLDRMKVPVYWLDHHPPVKRHNVTYLNPRIDDDKDNRATTYWAWQIVKDARPNDMWIAGIGIVSDWQLPDFRKEFEERYPGLLPAKVKTAPQALFDEKIGILAKIFAFNLKGTTKDALTAVKIFTRISSPDELLHEKTAAAKFVHKRYSKVKAEYQKVYSMITPDRSKFLIFTYDTDSMSLSNELSNELLYRNPRKVILIARHHQGEFKCSFRADARYSQPIDAALKKALEGIDGYGGGHAYACGGSIKEHHFERFVEQFKKWMLMKKVHHVHV